MRPPIIAIVVKKLMPFIFVALILIFCATLQPRLTPNPACGSPIAHIIWQEVGSCRQPPPMTPLHSPIPLQCTGDSSLFLKQLSQSYVHENLSHVIRRPLHSKDSFLIPPFYSDSTEGTDQIDPSSSQLWRHHNLTSPQNHVWVLMKNHIIYLSLFRFLVLLLSFWWGVVLFGVFEVVWWFVYCLTSCDMILCLIYAAECHLTLTYCTSTYSLHLVWL